MLANAGITSPPVPSIDSFSASPQTISPGDDSSLSWEVSQSLRVSLDNGIGYVPAEGTINVSPQTDENYTLTAGGPGGEVAAQTTITVAVASNEPPSISAPESITTLKETLTSIPQRSDIRSRCRTG